jgi:2'-5' RNA ligase
VPEAVRRVVTEIVEQVHDAQDGDPDGSPHVRRAGSPRWVDLNGLHLTLRFLGPTAEVRLPALKEALDLAGAGRPAFRVAIAGAGAFPSMDRPRAIWLGVQDPEGGLAGLSREVSLALVAAGWPLDERPFTAHLTLARTDGVRSGPRVARRLVAATKDLEAWFEVDRVVLYESHTGRGPARYEPLHEVALAG